VAVSFGQNPRNARLHDSPPFGVGHGVEFLQSALAGSDDGMDFVEAAFGHARPAVRPARERFLEFEFVDGKNFFHFRFREPDRIIHGRHVEGRGVNGIRCLIWAGSKCILGV